MAQEGALQVPIEWHIPDDLHCQYATNFVVQGTDHEFVLSFFQISPPLILGTPEEVQQKLAQMETIKAECVARVILSPGRMQELVDMLKTHWESYLNRARTEGD